MIKKIVRTTYWFGLLSPVFVILCVICMIYSITTHQKSEFSLMILLLAGASAIGYALRMLYNIRPRPEPESKLGMLLTSNDLLFFIWLSVTTLEFSKAFN